MPWRLDPPPAWRGAAWTGWTATLAGGVLWGCALAAIEALREPPVGLPPERVVGFLLGMLILWLINGVCWAVLARLAFAHLRPVWTGLVCVAGALGMSALQAMMNVEHAVLTLGLGMWAVFGHSISFEAMFAHSLWLNAVFGGLYVAGYSAFLRAVRSSRRLAQLQLALSSEAALLQEARLLKLRGALEPKVLTEAVTVLRARYDTDPAAADALLDQLVGYLRLAIGGPGRGALGEVAEAYRSLRRAMDDPVQRLPETL